MEEIRKSQRTYVFLTGTAQVHDWPGTHEGGGQAQGHQRMLGAGSDHAVIGARMRLQNKAIKLRRIDWTKVTEYVKDGKEGMTGVGRWKREVTGGGGAEPGVLPGDSEVSEAVAS